MLNLIKRANSKTEDIETAEHVYLRTLIENIDFLDLKSDAIKYGLDLMTMQMQHHEVLTNEMVEFYLYYRIKELNLKDTCKNVFVSAEESNVFGYYTLEGNGLKGGTLKIYSKYLTNLFGKYTKKWTREGINDIINLNYIRMLSHELKHNLKMQKCGKKLENSDAIQFFNQIGTNKEINYYTRNSILQNRVGKEIYRNNHKTFIEEVEADLFAIFDANFQLLIDFEGAFPKYILENFVSGNAEDIVSFYTNEEGIMLSPMEKFDIFYKANIGDEEDPIVEEENPDIMNSLITGDKIPLDVFEFLQKIAKGEIKTTDLYKTLTTYIESRTNINQFVTEELNEESSLSIR